MSEHSRGGAALMTDYRVISYIETKSIEFIWGPCSESLFLFQDENELAMLSVMENKTC